MRVARKTVQVVIWGTLLSLAASVAVNGQRNHRGNHRRNHRHATATAPAAATPVDISGPPRLKLIDGSTIAVDEAWESEQGIWYRRGGMSHLIARDRVKAIERGALSKSKADPQVAKVVALDEAQSNADDDAKAPEGGESDQPVWIYLVGGARVEADSVTESTAGAWYRRGSLSVFVERARIDHIEREVEALADSDSSKKARGWTTGNSKIDSLIKQNGARHGVDPYLILRNGTGIALQHACPFSKGAWADAVDARTSARFGIRKPSDPAQNIAGGTRYLKQLLGRLTAGSTWSWPVITRRGRRQRSLAIGCHPIGNS